MKRILCMVCIFAMVISLCNVAVFASGTESDVITITRAEDFATYISLDSKTKQYWGKTFRIEGEDDLGNGLKGIDLTRTDVDFGIAGGPQPFTSLSGFYGNIEGVEGFNNIKTSATIFSTVATANGDLTFKNVNIIGTGEERTGLIEINASSPANGYSPFIGAGTGTNKIIIENVKNYISIKANAKKAVAGLLGFTTGTFEITNCENHGNIENNGVGDAGGLAGTIGKAGNPITSSRNYGAVTSNAGVAGGIVAKASANVTKSANYGKVESKAVTGGTNSDSTVATAGGISGYTANVSESFNVGTVTSNNATGGIVGTGATDTYEITNCYNLGKIDCNSEDTAYGAGGISGYSSSASRTPVTYCYNAGVVEGKSAYPIGKGRVNSVDLTFLNNYYVSAEPIEGMLGEAITLADLSKDVPAVFDTTKWEMVDDSLDFYSYPQIVGNTFYPENKEKWVYVAPVTSVEVGPASEDVLFVKGEDATFDESLAGEGITGGYAIVAAKFEVSDDVKTTGFEYGMLISEEENFETCKEAKAENNFEGAFGILFWGEMEDGKTYYVRPYIKYNNEYTFGTGTSFVFDAE